MDAALCENVAAVVETRQRVGVRADVAEVEARPETRRPLALHVELELGVPKETFLLQSGLFRRTESEPQVLGTRARAFEGGSFGEARVRD